MQSPNILLIGIGGVYNYGCEAQVRGTATIIHRAFPSANVSYASSIPEYDQTKLSDVRVRIIERKQIDRYSIRNISRKLLSYAGIKWLPIQDSLDLLENIDIVFSIGGDLYTLGPTGDYTFSFPKFGDAALQQGRAFILWGASVGPFTKNPQAERRFTKHLKRLSLITAREPETLEYLNLLGVSDNVVACADPAFVVATEIVKHHDHKSDNPTIGINLSPLSSHYSGLSIGESVLMQARAIEGLVRTFRANIVLIPHVVCDFDAGDDDRRYLRRIKESVEPEYQDYLNFLDSDSGFIDIKKELIKCDMIIAARMHCAINALAAHVPTIFLSYSSKSLGMSQYVYGNRDWVITLEDFVSNDSLEKKVESMMNQEHKIIHLLADRIPEIQEDAYRPIHRLESLISM